MKTIIALAIALFATTAGAEELEQVKQLKSEIFAISNAYCNTLAAGINDKDSHDKFHMQCMVNFAKVSGLAQQVGRMQAIDQMIHAAAGDDQ